jgi:hypothetical protein
MLRDPSRRGKKLDLVLLATWRAAEEGPHKRRLLDQLVWENEPLVKVIIDQLCGRSTSKRSFSKLPRGGEDFSTIPWEDAYQAGLMALMKALSSYDPAKGGIAGHLRWSCLYQLQCICQREGLSRAPRGSEHELPAFDLVGEQRVLDERTRGHHEDGLLTADGWGAEDVQRWQDTGEWPDTPEAALLDAERERLRRLRADAMGWLKDAMPRLFQFRRAGRVEAWAAHNHYRLDCRANRAEELERPVFVRALCATGLVRECWVRTGPYANGRGLAGVQYA